MSFFFATKAGEFICFILQAQAAIEILENSTEIQAQPFNVLFGMTKSATEINYLSFELSWCRRLPKPNGFINLHDDSEKDIIANALVVSLPSLTGWSSKINTRKANSIMINGVATTSESEFRQVIDCCLAEHGLADSYQSCALGRDKGHETSLDMIKTLEHELIWEIKNKCALENIDSAIKIKQPYPSAVNYMADFIVPVQTSEENAELIDSLCDKSLSMRNQPIELKIKVTVIIGVVVYEAIKDQFLKAAEELNKSFPSLYCVFLPKQHPFKAEISATSGAAIKVAKQLIEELSQGVTFDCKNFPIFLSLSSSDFLKKFCKPHNIFAANCMHKRQIVFYGNKPDIEMCIARIQKFERESSQNQVVQVEIQLNQPKGLIKHILQQFDHKLDNLQRNIGLENCFVLQWNFASHSILFEGTHLGYNSLVELINGCANKLQPLLAQINEG